MNSRIPLLPRLLVALLTAAAMVFGAPALPTAAAGAAVYESPAVADQLIVGYRADATPSDRAAARRSQRAELLEELVAARADRAPVELVRLPAGTDRSSAIRSFRSQRGVAYAEPNWLVQHAETSNDPYYTGGNLWGMYGNATSPANQYGSQAGEAWAGGNVGTPSVYIGVIDEGIDHSHPDLDGNVGNPGELPFGSNGIDDDGNGKVDDLYGWDFFNNDATVYDGGNGDKHGTHVAGTIGAEGGNGIGVVGMAWDVGLISGKFLGPNGGSTVDAVKAIDYFTDLKGRGVNVVATNNSWGGGGFSQALLDAITRGANAGILFVAAAGNDSADTDATAHYPSNYATQASAGYDAVISVASITSSGALSSFSNYGDVTVDLGAPGSSIYSTLPKNTYGGFSGTSMATPHVSGAVALYAASNPGLPAVDIRSAILSSAVPTASLAGKTVTGDRLDVTTFILGPQVADLSLTKTASSSTAQPGDVVTYKVTAVNQGPGIAAEVSVVDTLPAGVTFSSAAATQGNCSGTVSVVCELGTLSSGAQATVTIAVTADDLGALVNTASVSSDATDPDSSDDTAAVTVTVDNDPPIAVLVADTTSAVAGLAVSFDGSGTTDDGTIALYRLEFGNGAAVGGSWPRSWPLDHSYEFVGTYAARLTVTDVVGAVGVATVTISVAANESPTAVLGATPDVGTAPLPVEFATAGTSSPEDDLTAWKLEFGDGTTPASGSGAPPATVTHTYGGAGSFTARLTVTDVVGSVAEATGLVAVTNGPPVASVSASPNPVVEDQSTSFSTAGTADSDNGGVASWKLEFGDGTGPSSGSGAPPTSVPHTYTTPGSYAARLTVTDTHGAAASDTEGVAVNLNQVPTAALAATPATGNAPLAVRFSTAGSSDPEGSIGSWSLDFGDGTTTASASGPPPATVNHTYSSFGSYNAVLTVTDGVGQPDTDNETVTVNKSAPSASLAATPTSGTVPLGVTFSPSGTDPDGTIASWSLSFGDGSPLATGSGPPSGNVPHTYTVIGSYTATLTVTDNHGLTGVSSRGVTVNPNLAPTAALAVSPASGTTPLPVTFSASGSDPDGTIASWSLSFGDGTTPASGGGAPPATVDHTYIPVGSYTATLTVTDNHGLTGVASRLITVSPSTTSSSSSTTTTTTTQPPPPSSSSSTTTTTTTQPPPPSSSSSTTTTLPLSMAAAARVFLFAEGTTRPGFYEELDLANTLAVPLQVSVAYQFSQDTPRPTLVKTYTVSPRSTLAVLVATEVGTGFDLSLRVEEVGPVTGGLVAQRVQYFDVTSRPGEPHWTGMHDKVGASEASTRWYFAEGTTLPAFTEFLTLQNPDPSTPAAVRLTYQPDRCDGPDPADKLLTLPPASRTTVRVSDPTDPNGAGGVVCIGLGATVEVVSGPAIVAERPLYFVHDFGAGPTSDGHDSFGATSMATEFFFAEGTTLPGFHEFLTFANPGTADAAVTIEYADHLGTTSSRGITVPAGQRETVAVFDAASPGGLGAGLEGVSAHVRSSAPIVAERPLYVVRDLGAGLVTGGHDALGASGPATTFSFAGGSTDTGHETFLTVLNPDPVATASLTLDFIGPGGVLRSVVRTVPPHTRLTLRLSDPALVGPGVAGPIGTVLVSDIGVVVERPAYAVTSLGGLSVSGASNALGYNG